MCGVAFKRIEVPTMAHQCVERWRGEAEEGYTNGHG